MPVAHGFSRRACAGLAFALLASSWFAVTCQEKKPQGQPYRIMKVGETPPPMNFRGLAGAPAPAWESLRRQVVVLEFWATWCPPCVKGIPEINALVERFSGKPVQFFSVTYEGEQIVSPFLKEHPLRTQVVIDNGCSMFRSYKAWGIPMVVIVGVDGKVKAVIHTEKLTAGLIDEVLAGKIPRVEQSTPYKDPKGAEQYFCGAAVK